MKARFAEFLLGRVLCLWVGGLLISGGVRTAEGQSIVITNQPQSQSILEGDALILTVGPQGAGPFTFQWFKGGVTIPNATNQVFNIASPVVSDSGYYSVLVGQGAETVLSSNATVGVAFRPRQLNLYHDNWRFNQDGTNLDTAWREASYDDNAWPSGQGIFGLDPDNPLTMSLIRTPLVLSNAAGVRINTHYFRTTIPGVDTSYLSSLRLTNLIDDGAVFYVNGYEVYRQNMPAAPAPITYTTAASTALEAATTVVNVPVNILTPSTNAVIAVELHNVNATSSDAVFGSSIFATFKPPMPPVITNQPQSQSVYVGSSVTFTSGVAGAPLTLQWLKDGTAIPGETNLLLTIPQCTFTNTGQYVLQASNFFTVVRTTPADLRVVASNGIPLVILPFTNGWKYEASGTDLGAAWRQPGYIDSAWTTGRAAFTASLFGYPEEVNTLVSLTNAAGAKVNTYYFRTHFNLPLQTTNVNVTLSDLVDDGAVFYLNGKEVARVNMPAGTISYNSLATSSRGDGGKIESFVLGLLPLVRGDNVLAVEVHQGSTTSSDIAFDASMAVTPRALASLEIISEPQDVVAREYESVGLGCALFGSSPVQIQWYKGAVALAGATNATLVLAKAHATDSGSYFCLASNPLNSVTSRVVQVTVTPDSTPPQVLDAISYGPSSVLVRFDEAVNMNFATAVSNYAVLSTPVVSIKRFTTNAVLVSFAQPLLEGAQLEVRNIQDLAVPPNSLQPPVVVSVGLGDKSAFTHPLTAVKTVFLIMFENHSWEQILGNTNAPYFNSLLNNASYASRYFSPPGLHPSLPNYLWLYAGTNFGILDDGNPSSHHFATHNHLPYLLDRAGVPWKSYQENITGTDCPMTGVSPYAVRHNPAMYFDDVISDFDYCTNHVRPYPELGTDLSNRVVSGFVFITPNTTNDMHDGTVGVSEIKTGDNWLAAELPKILNSTAFSNNGAVFITWDEDDFGTPQDPIGMIVLSPLAKGGGYMNTNYYTHSSTLRTLQEIFGVRPLLSDAANAHDLSDLFKLLSVSVSGLNNGQVSLTITNSVAGKTNILEASSDLVNWTGVSTNVSTTNYLQVLDSPQAPASTRFYRVFEQR